MSHKSMLMLIVIWISMAVNAQTPSQPLESASNDNETATEAQPVMVVTSDPANIPAPIQATAAAINAVAGGASVETSDTWSANRATNIKDLLSSSTGVYVQQRNGAESARVSIRGSGLGRQFQGGGLLLLQDGVPLNTADGAFDFQAIDPWLTDYVSVFRGANGISHGGNTLGGVINFGTTLPGQNTNNTFRLAAGSYATQQAMLGLTSVSPKPSKDAMRIRISHFNQAGFRVQNQQRSNRIDWQYLLNHRHHSQRFSFYHLNTYAELPSSLSKALIKSDPRQSRGFNISGNFHRDLTLSRLAYHFNEATDNGLSATLFWSKKQLVNPVFTYIDRDSDDYGFRVNWQKGYHQLRLDSQLGWQDERRRENNGGLPGVERLYREQQATTSSLLYQYQRPSNHHQLTTTFALQALYAIRDIKELAPMALNSQRSYQQINPRVGLLYQQTPNHQWFGNLSRSFEPPSFAELNNGNQAGINTPITAQSADTLELGTRGFSSSLQWDLAIYYSQINNEFIRFRFPNGDTKTTNADQSNHFGLESGLNWNIKSSWLSNSDALQLGIQYQWNQFKLDNDPTFGNNQIPGIPEHHLQANLTYQHPQGWKISPNIEWVPTAYYIDLANSYRSDQYLLTGISWSYASPGGIEWFLDAKNLNNQNHISTTLPIPDAGGTDGNYFYSGEGRSFYAGMKIAF